VRRERERGERGEGGGGGGGGIMGRLRVYPAVASPQSKVQVYLPPLWIKRIYKFG